VVGLGLFGSDQLGYLENIFASAVSIILAVTVLDIRADRRSRLDRQYEAEQAEARATEQRKRDLILQMSSTHHEFAVAAVPLLSQKGWLTDGSLQGINLAKCNLQEADLKGANLQRAIFYEANLEGADLRKANLKESV